MSHAVKVRLRKPRRVFTFVCTDPALKRDEPCIVQTERGAEWGICILPPEPLPREMEERIGMRVLRRADDRDAQTLDWMIAEERRSYTICKERIEKHGLPMKLVDVEVTFDKRKVIFLFTADDRIDFRELVRDLAHDLRTRIEMRHIQVRDEAGLVGGLGGCGRELCCSTWLTEFKPISMRMAKKQNLSLNPSKISGQCGRLLCCLAYENDQYEMVKKRKREQRPEEIEPRTPPRRALPAPGAGDYEVPSENRAEPSAPQRDNRGDRDRGPRQDDRRGPQGPRQGGQDRPQRPAGDRDRDRGPRRDGPPREGGQREGGQREGAPRDAQQNRAQEQRPPRPQQQQQAPRPERNEPRRPPAPGNEHPLEQTPHAEGGEAAKKRRGGRSRRRGRGGSGGGGGAQGGGGAA